MNNQRSENCELISLQEAPEERSYDFVPKTFQDFIGQDTLKQKLYVFTQAALKRNEALDHLLLFGPPGLGKTTLSQIMAQVLGVDIKIISGPMMERTGDLVAILSSLAPKDILFIDEIHRMPTAVEEVLYSAMEQFRVDVIIGQGAGAKSVSLPINPFTLIGATTKSGTISAPLRSRFGISERFDYYDDEDLAQIIMQSAEFLDINLEEDAALFVAQCSRGTPRIAKKIVRRLRDFAQVHEQIHIDYTFAQSALEFLGIDHDGLTSVDNMLLRKMIENFNGGPVAVDTLASIIGEDTETIKNVYEPYLMRKGYIEKTPRGRQIPAKRLPQLIKKFMGQDTIF